jgi:hypothetical protein
MATTIANESAALLVAYCLTGISLWTINRADFAQAWHNLIGAVSEAPVQEKASTDESDILVKTFTRHAVPLAAPVGPVFTLPDFQLWQLGRYPGAAALSQAQPGGVTINEILESRRRMAMAVILYALAEGSKRTGD